MISNKWKLLRNSQAVRRISHSVVDASINFYGSIRRCDGIVVIRKYSLKGRKVQHRRVEKKNRCLMECVWCLCHILFLLPNHSIHTNTQRNKLTQVAHTQGTYTNKHSNSHTHNESSPYGTHTTTYLHTQTKLTQEEHTSSTYTQSPALSFPPKTIRSWSCPTLCLSWTLWSSWYLSDSRSQ